MDSEKDPSLHLLQDDFVMIERDDKPGGSDNEDYLDAICEQIEGISDDLRQISISIHDDPEVQYKEYHAHKILTEYLMKQSGWKVTPSAYGIETAFVAVYDSGKKGAVASFNAEYGTLDTLKPEK